jgi:hypothetical protein
MKVFSNIEHLNTHTKSWEESFGQELRSIVEQRREEMFFRSGVTLE